MKIVTIGGGTGQNHVLRSLRLLAPRISDLHITAIPTTSDSAGSSGVLRYAHDIVAPGDISQCMFGLHPRPDEVFWLFGERFKRGNGSVLEGHTLRNMIVVAAFQGFGVSQAAMDAIKREFSLQGDIAPVTFSRADVCVKLKDGAIIRGEGEIYEANLLRGGGITEAWLEPDGIVPNQKALDAIKEADIIVVCPGTLACSIIPNFLVPGMKEALVSSNAIKAYVMNLMNRRGHIPENWNVPDYVRFIESYLNPGFFQAIICNTQPLSEVQMAAYRGEKEVMPLMGDWTGSGRDIYAASLLMDEPLATQPNSSDTIGHLRALVRHDPRKLAPVFEAIVRKVQNGYS